MGTMGPPTVHPVGTRWTPPSTRVLVTSPVVGVSGLTPLHPKLRDPSLPVNPLSARDLHPVLLTGPVGHIRLYDPRVFLL